VLLEGRTVDFLYGPHGLARAMAAKNLIRGLREDQHFAAIRFYIGLYSAVVKYHSNVSHCSNLAVMFCVYPSKDIFWSDIEIAFEEFKSSVKTMSSYQREN
jgi:hypothetical protein